MTNDHPGKDDKDNHEYNIFRDSLVRYLGYANEVGESFRYQFPKLVTPSYIVSFGYCFADAATSGFRAYNEANKSDSPNAIASSFVSSADVLVWQSLASVMIPGATIHAIVKGSRFALLRSPLVLPTLATTWLPTGVGLGSIPLIIHPIDTFVDYLMDSTFRQVDWIKSGSGDKKPK